MWKSKAFQSVTYVSSKGRAKMISLEFSLLVAKTFLRVASNE